jgi:hypothetical protein
MAAWESVDEGKTWARKAVLTSNSSRNHSYARRPSVMHPGFVALWADGNADTMSVSKLYFSDAAGSVYELPYDMKQNFQKPKKLLVKEVR